MMQRYNHSQLDLSYEGKIKGKEKISKIKKLKTKSLGKGSKKTRHYYQVTQLIRKKRG